MKSTSPSVSVIIPARDATAALPRALASIEAQTYPNITEVVVACADEATAESAAREGAKALQNPAGTTPAGLNLAIAATTGEVVVRCDAQSVLPTEYIERAVKTLAETGAANVGGMQVPVGDTYWERSIAKAMVSRIGSGNAAYRVGGEAGPVETVYLGVFRREALTALDGYDEAFVRTQDYELNHRIIESGELVWFDPSLKVEYTPRGSLPALWSQYYEYGRAKRRMSRKHPRSLRWRQSAPPVIVLALTTSLLLAIFSPWAWFIPGAYVLTLLTSAIMGGGPLGTAMALLTMHVSWGLGFLRG